MSESFTAASPWQLQNFIERLDLWTERESPSDDLALVVTAWILSRTDDPYQGARREAGFDDYWFAVIPNSREADGTVVVCSYWISEQQHAVRCDLISSLMAPIS